MTEKRWKMRKKMLKKKRGVCRKKEKRETFETEREIDRKSGMKPILWMDNEA